MKCCQCTKWLRCFSIVFLLLVFTLSSVAQELMVQKYISTLVKKVIEFQPHLNKGARDFSTIVLNKTSLEDLKKFAKHKFEADEENPIAISQFLIKKGEESDSIRRLTHREIMKPGFIEHKFLEIVKSEISEIVYALLSIPYFLKIEVINVRNTVPKTETEVLKGAPITVVKAIARDVVKGKHLFNEGDTVQFYFYDFWLKQNIEFNETNKYFVLLDIRNWTEKEVFNIKNDPPSLALVTYIGNPNGFYPIINEEFYDSTNFFQLGTKISYKVFQKELRQQIQTIKSW